jgi:hypothetical protein
MSQELSSAQPVEQAIQASDSLALHRASIARGTAVHSELGRMFWLWWKTLSGSYLVFMSTSRS